MFKLEKIRKAFNIVCGVVIIILLLFSGIQFPTIFTVPNGDILLNRPIVIAFFVVFGVFLGFNAGFLFEKEQLIKEEVREVEKE